MWTAGNVVLWPFVVSRGLGCVGASWLRLPGLVQLSLDLASRKWRTAECLDPRFPALALALPNPPSRIALPCSRIPKINFLWPIYFGPMRALAEATRVRRPLARKAMDQRLRTRVTRRKLS